LEKYDRDAEVLQKLRPPLNTAFDFRVRLRFPRVAREPPRQACGVSHKLLFPQESSSYTPIKSWIAHLQRHFMHAKKSSRIICFIVVYSIFFAHFSKYKKADLFKKGQLSHMIISY
jgi:hypothetical protein